MQVLWPHPLNQTLWEQAQRWGQQALELILRHPNLESYDPFNCHMNLLIRQLSCKPLESWNVALRVH